jgi:tetrahydromethanopterin S-methyltransferase subunit F
LRFSAVVFAAVELLGFGFGSTGIFGFELGTVFVVAVY